MPTTAFWWQENTGNICDSYVMSNCVSSPVYQVAYPAVLENAQKFPKSEKGHISSGYMIHTCKPKHTMIA